MATITTRDDVRQYLDTHLPFLRSEGRLKEATDAVWRHLDTPPIASDWSEWLDSILGEDGNGIYSVMDEAR